MARTTYTAPVFGRTVIATATSGTAYSAARRAALAYVAAGHLIDWEDVAATLKYSEPGAKSYPAPFGPLDVADPGSEVRRRRWVMAYLTTCEFYGLPLGTIYVPCYICGQVFDAWTCDAEHTDRRLGTTPGTLILACHPCNLGKSDAHVPDARIVDRLYSLRDGAPWVRGSAGILPVWHARTRREDGSDMAPERP